MKSHEEEAAGISAEKQGFRTEEEQIQAQRQRGGTLSQAWWLAVEKAGQAERPTYPPVFLMYRKYTRAAIRAAPARTPITMPAIAPSERPGLAGVDSSVMAGKEKNEWR